VKDIEEFVLNGKRLEIPREIPPKINELIKNCWHQDRDLRPPFSEIVERLNSILPTLSSGDLPIPQGDLASIGWSGEIERGALEQKMKNAKPGTFLTRWSKHTRSYVLTYARDDRSLTHIAYIKPTPEGTITVDKEDGTKSHYPDLFAYVQAMMKNGIIKQPLEINEPSLYGFSPDLYSKAPVDKKL